MKVFKGFLSRTLYICSEKHLAQKIKFLINSFAENRHSITVLEKISKEYMNSIISVKEKENIDTIKNDNIVKLCGYRNMDKLRKEFKNFNIKIIFTSGRNLNNLICRNKSKLHSRCLPIRLHLQCPIYWRN